MAFSFDNIISGAKDIFDKASEKAGEALDYSKTQIDRSQYRVKLKEKYVELGKAYFDAQVEGADTAETMVQLIEEIKELNTKLIETDAKKNKTCPGCGAENDGTSAFCTVCGGKLE